jgi:predicted dehydrogenase
VHSGVRNQEELGELNRNLKRIQQLFGNMPGTVWGTLCSTSPKITVYVGNESMENIALVSSPQSLATSVTRLRPQSSDLTTQQTVGIAVFGVGRWGSHLLRNFLAHPQARVVAVVDPRVDRLSTFAQQYAIESQVVLTPDWTEALQLPGVEAVVVATPAVTHYMVIQAALQQGHHVLAEKPLTLEVTEALKLCHLAAQQQRQLVIDHTYLFHPAVGQGREVVQQGALGKLRYGYATRTHLGPVRQDVDALWDLAIHDIAIFNHWLNETPTQVQAQGTVWLQPGCSGLGSFAQGLSDMVWVKLTYPSGFQAFIHLCWSNADKQRRLCLAGSQGTLVFDELRATAPLTLLQGRLESIDQQFVPLDQHEQVLSIAAVEPLQQVCSHFLNCAQHNTPSQVSPGWLGAELVQILSALTASLHQGGAPMQVKRLH